MNDSYGKRTPLRSGAPAGVELCAYGQLRHATIHMCHSVTAFAAASGLYEFANGKPDLITNFSSGISLDVRTQWLLLAVRQGAIALKDFEDALVSANTYLFKELKISKMSEGKSPVKTLAEKFPNISGIRNFAAHGSAFSSPSEGVGKHVASGRHTLGPWTIDLTDDQLFMGMLGRQLVGTWKGKLCSYELSEESLSILEDIKSAFFTWLPTEWCLPE